MTTIDYTCKVCHTARTADYDETCPIQKLEAWRGMLTCNRCHDFYNAYSRLGEAIGKLCYLLTVSRANQRDSIRSGLVTKTKRLATVTCDYYWLANVWDEEIVSMLMDHPDKHHKIIQDYHRHIKRTAKEAQKAA